MKLSGAFLSLLIVSVFTPHLSAEEEVWYNAEGEIVKITEAKKQPKNVRLGEVKKPYTSSALYALHGGSERGVQRFRTGYSSYPQYYHYPVWSGSQRSYSGNAYRSSYRGSNRFQGSYRRGGFSGSYRGNGWSVRLNF